MLQEVKRDIKQEECRIKQLSPDLTEEKSATKPKHSVIENLMSKAAGATTGAFLGGAIKLIKEERSLGLAVGIALGTAAGVAAAKGIMTDAATQDLAHLSQFLLNSYE